MLLLKELPFYSSLTSKSRPKTTEGIKPCEVDGIQEFFSVRFASSNAKEMAQYFQMVFGMTKVAFQGLENGNKCVSSHVLVNGKVTFEVMGSLETRTDIAYSNRVKQTSKTPRFSLIFKESSILAKTEKKALEIVGESARVRACVLEALRYDSVQSCVRSAGAKDKDIVSAIIQEANMASFVSDFVASHGVGIFDVVFKVKGLKRVFSKAVATGATVIRQPEQISDEYGSVWIATVGTPLSDLHHTLVEIIDYTGPYLPNYAKVNSKSYGNERNVLLNEIDHCVQNFTWNQLVLSSKFYISAFGFHKFWSVDDRDVGTSNSGLRSIVLANSNESVLMPINEPVKSKMRGQIEEFYDYFGGPGVQHVALRTSDIISCITELRSRGMEFNTMSERYYDDLKTRLNFFKIELHEDFKLLKQNNIAADFDPSTRFKQKNGLFHCHYILQIFSKPIHDRPTLFFEIIQRHNHNGFGKGTFKGLFESIEEQQKLRKTLVPTQEEK